MKLYHGTNTPFNEIDLNKSRTNKDFDKEMKKAFDTLYNSDTYAKLSDPKTGLYIQSAGYIYSYLKTEITTGEIE